MPIIVAGQSKKSMILFPGLFYTGLCPVYTFRQPTLNRFTLFGHWMNFIQSTTVQAIALTQFHTIWTLDKSSSRVQLYRPLAKLRSTTFEEWMNFIQRTLYRPVYSWWAKKKSIRAWWAKFKFHPFLKSVCTFIQKFCAQPMGQTQFHTVWIMDELHPTV